MIGPSLRLVHRPLSLLGALLMFFVCAGAPGAAAQPRALVWNEVTAAAPGNDWRRIDASDGLQILRGTAAAVEGASLNVWPVDVPPRLRARTRDEHVKGYFASEQRRPRKDSRWEDWDEGDLMIGGRAYPTMLFRLVTDGFPTRRGAFVVCFPDDFAASQRFYVVMWLGPEPSGAAAPRLDELKAFVASLRLGPVPRSPLVDRAARFVTSGMERALGAALTGVELVPFESALARTVKWQAVAPERADKQEIRLPTKILAEFPADYALMVTVLGTADNDALARELLASLRTTTEPDCFWPIYRAMHKGREAQAAETEAKLRAAAAAGNAQALVMQWGPVVIFFDNNAQIRPCHTFKISGQWLPGNEAGLLVAPNGRSLVGVEFFSPERLRGFGY